MPPGTTSSDISIAAAVAAVEASLSYHRCPILLLRNNGRVATASSAAVLYSPQKPSPMDGLNLASRQRDASFWQQQSCLPRSLSRLPLSRWMKLSKLSPSLERARGGRKTQSLQRRKKIRLKWEGRTKGERARARHRRRRPSLRYNRFSPQ